MIMNDTVNQQMYDLILSMILEYKLKPGERIDPKALAHENGVSLMPVRNALQQLTAQGLVETRQRVGAFVRQYSNAELCQIVELRKLYELHSLQAYCKNINRAELIELYQQIEKLDPNDPAMLLLDERLHMIIIEASNNPFLIQQYNNMVNMFRIHMYNESPDKSVSKKEHLSLIRAIYKGDTRLACLVLEQHLEHAMEDLSTHGEYELIMAKR